MLEFPARIDKFIGKHETERQIGEYTQSPIKERKKRQRENLMG